MWYKTVVEIFSFMWTGILPATSYPWTRSSYVPVGVPVVLMALFFCCEHMKYSAEEGVLLCHAHRASVTKKLLKYPGFIMLHYNIYIYIYIYIYEWKISLEQFFWWMEKEQKDMIVVEMKFPWNMLNWKLPLSNHSFSHLLSVMCQKVQFTLQQIC